MTVIPIGNCHLSRRHRHERLECNRSVHLGEDQQIHFELQFDWYFVTKPTCLSRSYIEKDLCGGRRFMAIDPTTDKEVQRAQVLQITFYGLFASLNEFCPLGEGNSRRPDAYIANYCTLPVPINDPENNVFRSLRGDRGIHCWIGIPKHERGLPPLFNQLSIQCEDRCAANNCCRPTAEGADPVPQAVVIRIDAPSHLIECGSGHQNGQESATRSSRCHNENSAFRSVQHGGSDSMLRRAAA